MIDKNKVAELLDRISQAAEGSNERDDLIFELVDNYRDVKIVPFLVGLIESSNIENLDSTLVYSCHEYSIEECLNYFELWIRILIDSNYESAWAALSILSDLRDIYSQMDINRVNESYEKLKNVLNPSTETGPLIEDAIFYLEEDFFSGEQNS